MTFRENVVRVVFHPFHFYHLAMESNLGIGRRLNSLTDACHGFIIDWRQECTINSDSELSNLICKLSIISQDVVVFQKCDRRLVMKLLTEAIG